MSGGSYSYIYSRLEEECNGRMYDAEMNDLITDLCEVLHDLEWWQSGDTSEEHYRNTLTKFKAKWFKGNRKVRLKGYIDEQIGMVRSQLYSLIGVPQESEECRVETIPKDQYEQRLKADMVAMLTEIQLEIKEKFNDRPFSYNHHQRTEFYRDIDEIIQQKINALRGN